MTTSKYILLLCCIVLLNPANAQDFGAIASQKAFDLSGNFSLSTNFYGTSREINGRAPFSYVINGSPTISLYGINIPLTFTYSNQQLTYAKPFQRYGASPYYKWVKVHLGYRSMNFSPYSITGQTFLGAGVELTPGKFKLSAFYGTLQNIYAQQDSALLGNIQVETYKRKGFGMKVGFEGERTAFDISLLKVVDKPESSEPKSADNTRLTPQDNIVISPSVRFTLFEKLVIQSAVAASVLTRNQLASSGLIDNNVIESFSSILVINQSTKLALAGDASARLNFNNFSIGLKYKKIEPLYQSLGLHGIANDFENYTVNGSINLFKKLLRIRASQGFQRNNLSDLRKVTSLRKIGSFNASMALQSGFSINAQYSNFHSDQEAGYVELNDSIRLALLNKSASISPAYNWRSENSRHTISLSASTQNFTDLNPREGQALDNKSNTSSLNYRLTIRPSALSLRVGINYSAYESNAQLTKRVGVSVGANKKLANKKLKLNLGVSYRKSKVNEQKDGFIMKGRVGINYSLNKKNALSVRVSVINRKSIIKEPFTDYRGRFSYSFKF